MGILSSLSGPCGQKVYGNAQQKQTQTHGAVSRIHSELIQGDSQ